MRQLDPQYEFTPDQIALRNAIGQRLQAGFQAPMAIQLLIVNFLYSPPGLLTIQNPQANLPGWLLIVVDIRGLHHQLSCIRKENESDVLPKPSRYLLLMPPQPDFGSFPDTLQELLANRVQLNRLLGLSNLYYIDPEDQEILQELRQVRLSLIDAINRCPESELEQIWATDLGDRYWALVRSGIQKEVLEHPLKSIENNLSTRPSRQSWRWLW